MKAIPESSKTHEAEQKPSDDDAAKKLEAVAARVVNMVLASGVELFHDDLGEVFANVPVGDHHEAWPCRGKNFKRWLAGRFWQGEAKALSSDALGAALNVIEAKGRFEGEEYPLHNRVAFHDGAIWYDLADRHWQGVKVTASGWEVVDRPPILFRRYAHQKLQPEPVGGSDLHQLLDFLNLRDPSQRLLLLVYLVCCFVPDIPHPIPVLHGPAGSAKTTLFRMLRRLVDPSVTEVLSFPRDTAELAQQLSHHWAPYYDNITCLSGWTSDILCRAVTGEGFSKRQLYTDDDDVIFQFRRCVGLNGVNVAVQKPDLLDRCILFGLEKIATSSRKPEKAIWAEFEAARPELLGAILDALSRAMAIRESIHLPELPRMADFALWGCAVASALGYSQDEFLRAYEDNAETRNDEALQASPVAAMMRELMDGRSEWEGTATALLAELEGLADEHSVNTKSKLWPKAAHVLSRRLNDVIPNLSAVDIEVTSRRDGRHRTITIRKSTEKSDTSVTTGADHEGPPDTAVDGDAISEGRVAASPEASHTSPVSDLFGGGYDADDTSDGTSGMFMDRQTWDVD